MKCGNSEIIHKDVVVVGNGPSGIALSFMLSGNIPYVTSCNHPDEFLSARLQPVLDHCLVHEDLAHLASGLEGRTTNPVSLLLDNLTHPYADIGLKMEPLITWRHEGKMFETFGHKCEIKSGIKCSSSNQKSFFSKKRRSLDSIRMINETNRRGYNFLRSQKKIENERRKQLQYPFIIHPFSDLQTFWELLMVVVLFFQFIMIPLDVAAYNITFPDKFVDTTSFMVMRCLTDFISLLNIGFTFFTGYCDNKERKVILAPKSIFWHYLGSHFILDLYASIPLDVILNMNSAYYKSNFSTGTLYILHYIALLKMARVVHFFIFFNNFCERMGVPYVLYCLLVSVTGFIVYQHFMCCCCIAWKVWQFSWSVKTSLSSEFYFGKDINTFKELYITTLYSSMLMTCTSGLGFSSTMNSSIFFTVCAWIISKLILIVLVGKSYILYTAMKSSSQKYVNLTSDVEEYMQHKQFPVGLQARVLAYYNVRFQSNFFQESEILNTVSGQLRQEIIMKTCRKIVESAPIFKKLPLTLLVRIVSCLRYEIYLTHDVITKAGCVGDCMFFVSNGTVAVFTKSGKEIDHVVLGKGPPGGSWHSMDPEILTLSLASWMSLPGSKYGPRNGADKRAAAKDVAKYYINYVKKMGLEDNFRNFTIVTGIRPYTECNNKWVEKVRDDSGQKVSLCTRPEPKEKSCTFSSALNYFWNRGKGRRERCSKRVFNPDILEPHNPQCYKMRLFNNNSNTCDSYINCDNYNTPSVPKKLCDDKKVRWIVEVYDLMNKRTLTYTCGNLVLANGSSDLPNRLSVSNDNPDPFWLLHDLRSLEIELDLLLETGDKKIDPVLIVGAGLSAADAIIALRARGIRVIHVFRNAGANLSKQLPENMYPEYHEVHKMMRSEKTCPLYTPLPEYSVTQLEESSRSVSLVSKSGVSADFTVSFAAVLIGSRPDLGFLPDNYNLGVRKQLPIDCKKNTVNINRLTHSINGFDNLYAIGPLAGDNFVRFLPGGAFATLCDLYKQYNL